MPIVRLFKESVHLPLKKSVGQHCRREADWRIIQSRSCGPGGHFQRRWIKIQQRLVDLFMKQFRESLKVAVTHSVS
jgi:hypothetical protein